MKTSLPEGTPLDLRLLHGKIGIILLCNPWAVGWSPEGTFYGFCMRKIGQNPKMKQLWCPVAPQPYVVQKSWPHIGSSLALGLQRGINMHLLTCSLLWVRYLFDPPQSLGFWGQMTPEWKLFINFCPKSAFYPWFTCRGRIWRKSAIAKLPKSRLVLPIKRCVRDTFEPPTPISPPLSRSRPKFRERCRPLTCACVPTLVQIGGGLPDLFRKESKKVKIIIGFQPTNICCRQWQWYMACNNVTNICSKYCHTNDI